MISSNCRAKRFSDEVETVVAEEYLIADKYRWGAEDPALGGRVRLGVGFLYALAVICIEAALLAAGAGGLAQGGLLLFASHLAWQAMRGDPGNGALALRLFRSNRDAGLLLFAGLAAEIFLASK